MRNSDLLYKYDSENRLENPEFYMYSKYHGLPFLKSYLNRRNTISNYFFDKLSSCDNREDLYYYFLKSQIDFQKQNNESCTSLNNFFPNIIKKLSSDIQKSKNINMEKYKSKTIHIDYSSVDTKSYLLNIYNNLISDSVNQKDNINSLLSQFIKRFEVNKKIYLFYENDFKTKIGDTNHLFLYSLLSVCCCLYYCENLNFKYLNLIIKINDTISSLADNFNNSTELLLNIFTINYEIIFSKQLMNKKGIQI